MTATKVIRYRPSPSVPTRTAPVLAVFDELAQKAPRGFLRHVAPRRRRQLRPCRRPRRRGEPLDLVAGVRSVPGGYRGPLSEGPVTADATAIGNFRLLP